MVKWDDIKLEFLKKILFILIFAGIVAGFGLNLAQACAILVLYLLIMSIIKSTFELGKFLISAGLMVAFVCAISYIYQWSSAFGVVAAIIIVSIITAIYLIIIQWDKYIEGIEQIERQIWGSTATERKNLKRSAKVSRR